MLHLYPHVLVFLLSLLQPALPANFLYYHLIFQLIHAPLSLFLPENKKTVSPILQGLQLLNNNAADRNRTILQL